MAWRAWTAPEGTPACPRPFTVSPAKTSRFSRLAGVLGSERVREAAQRVCPTEAAQRVCPTRRFVYQLPSNCCCGPHAPWPYKIERYAGNNLDRHYANSSSIRGLQGQQRGLDIGALCPLRTQRLVLLQHPAHVYTVALRSETEKGFWRKDRQINPQLCKSQACFQGSSIRSGVNTASQLTVRGRCPPWP